MATGRLLTTYPWVDCPKSDNIDRWGSVALWLTGMPMIDPDPHGLNGTRTTTPLITFAHWSLTGHGVVDLLADWRTCTVLLTRI